MLVRHPELIRRWGFTLPTSFQDAHKQVNSWFLEHYKLEDCQINDGHCFTWAYIMYCMLEGVTLGSFRDVDEGYLTYHAYIHWNGKYYDSQTPEGVTSPIYLDSCYINNNGEAMDTSGGLEYDYGACNLRSFTRGWYWYGKGRQLFADILATNCHGEHISDLVLNTKKLYEGTDLRFHATSLHTASQK